VSLLVPMQISLASGTRPQAPFDSFGENSDAIKPAPP
jgi:hypothetical protein